MWYQQLKQHKWKSPSSITLKIFCTAKKTVSKMKRQPVEWEKTFASHVSDEGLMLKIGKELIQLHNNKRIIIMGLNMGKAPERLPCSPHGKESAYNAGEQGLIPGLARSSGEGNGSPLQYSCLENPVGRGAWRATVRGVAKSRTWLND